MLDFRSWSAREYINAALIAGLALVPVYAAATGNTFVMTLLTRALIYAIAALSLNLILGYAGLVSFGHAMFIGIGAYAVGIMAFHGNANGFLQLPMAVLVSGFLALVVGALSLRTRGVYFIMITLAFAQMVYFAGVGLEYYGADDGMPLKRRSTLGPISLTDRTQLYLVCLSVLLLALADAAASRGPSMTSEDWSRHVGYMNSLLVRSMKEEGIVDPPRYLTGQDLIRGVGVPAGPRIGKLLELLREAQAAGEVSDRTAALAFVREAAGALDESAADDA